jgi:hypothetical protein
MKRLLMGIISFYLEGFRGMGTGRLLWKIILLKLFVMFAVLKPFFVPDYLETNFDTEAERADHVLAQLAGIAQEESEEQGAPIRPAAVRPEAGGSSQKAAPEQTKTKRR